MKLSIVLTAWDGDCDDVRKVVQCLHNQTCKDFELIPVLRGCQKAHKWVSGFSRLIYTTGDDAAPFKGNAERAVGLRVATGDYVCWVSADNLLYPNFVESHLRCTADVSVVNIDYWSREHYCGVFPQALELRKVDLLNFAVRTELAKSEEAFLRDLNVWESDWAVLERAMKTGSVSWDRNSPTCAAHF